uniref:alpha-2,3-sialyltransferase n=1 Tax=Helicobacter cetorum TaxID=138563 RepID=UPI000CF0820E
KPLIIAGNGPSIKDLDYSLFPSDFDVFRCNQFYFEDKYYLGREVKGAFFFAGEIFDVAMRTARQLVCNDEYAFCDIYCTTNSDYIDGCNIEELLKKRYVGIRRAFYFLQQLEPFFTLHKNNVNFYGKDFTSGIDMLIVAIALGYKEIYLCGIDFYENGLEYFYENKSEYFIPHPSSLNTHSKNIDLQAIELAKSYANLYALVPNSALNRYLPLSPNKNVLSIEKMQSLKLGEHKPLGYTSDAVFKKDTFGEVSNVRSDLKKILVSKGISGSNLYVWLAKRLVFDAISLVRGAWQLCKDGKIFSLLWGFFDKK